MTEGANNFGGFQVPAQLGTVATGGTLNIVSANQTVNFGIGDSIPIDDFDINANITGTGGVNGIVKNNGSSRMTLNGNNSAYTGNFTVTGGELLADNSNSLGSSGTLTINANTTFDISGNSTIPAAVAVVFQGQGNGQGNPGNGAAGNIRSIGGSNVIQGVVNLSNAANATLAQNFWFGVNAGSTLNLSGVVQDGPGGGNEDGVEKILGGTLIFSGSQSNTYNGTTYVYEGTLQLAKDSTNGADPALNTAEAINATLAPSYIIVSNDNGGPGADVLLESNSNQIDVADEVTVTPAGIWTFGNNAGFGGVTQTLTGSNGNVIGTAVNFYSNLTFSGTINLASGTLSLGGGLGSGNITTLSPGAPLYDAASPAPLITGNSTANLLLNGVLRSVTPVDNLATDDLTIDVKVGGTGGLGGAGGINKLGAGTLVLTQPGNWYTGVNAVQTLTFAGANTNATTFTLSYNNVVTPAISFSTTAATLQGNIQTALDDMLGMGATVVSTTTGGATPTVTITFNGNPGTSGGNIIYAGNAQPTLATSITSGGTLVNTATVAGGTNVVTAGTLAFGGNNSSGNNNGAASTAGSIDLGLLGGTGGALRADGPNAITVANAQITLAVTSTITGTNTFPTGSTAGTGSLTLTGLLVPYASASLNVTNTGTTTLSGGVEYGGWQSVAPAGITLTVSNNYNSPVVESGVIDDTGAFFLGEEEGKLSKTGTGTLTLAAANTYHGTTTVGAGVIQLTNARALGVNTAAQDVVSTTPGAGNGTFTLLYTLNGVAETTSPVAYVGTTAPAAQTVQNAINTLPALLPYYNPIGISAATSTIGGFSTNEVQTLTFTPGLTGGNFNLTFKGATTNNITYIPGSLPNTVNNITNALNGLSTIGGAGGSVVVNSISSTVFNITLTGTLGNSLQPTIIADSLGFSPAGQTATTSQITPGTSGTDAAQDIQFSGNATGGTFTVKTGGSGGPVSANLNWPAGGTSGDPNFYTDLATVLQNGLNSILGGAVNVTALGGPSYTNHYAVQFNSPGFQNNIVVNISGLTYPSPVAQDTVTTSGTNATNAVETLVFNPSTTGGNYTIDFPAAYSQPAQSAMVGSFDPSDSLQDNVSALNNALDAPEHDPRRKWRWRCRQPRKRQLPLCRHLQRRWPRGRPVHARSQQHAYRNQPRHDRRQYRRRHGRAKGSGHHPN